MQILLKITLITALLCLVISPHSSISAQGDNLLDKEQIKKYLSIPENDNQQIMYTLIQLLTNEWTDTISSADRSPREDGVITTLSHSIKINALKFLLLDAPVEVVQKVVLTSIRIARIAYGINNLGDVVGVIENETVKNAVQYGLNALLKNDIRVTSGALEINFVSYNNSQQNIIFQYVTTLKPGPDKTTGVAIAILSKDPFEPPTSTYKTPWRYDDWLSEGHTKIEPFIITIQGQMQKGQFNAYYWRGAPSIAITFPDKVPDLGFRPKSFLQRHLWQPIENQVQDAMVLLQKFIPSTSGIIDGLGNLYQNIKQTGSSVGNSLLEFFSNTGASVAGFVLGSPAPNNQPIDLTSQMDLSALTMANSLADEMASPISPPIAPQPAPTQPATTNTDALANQLAALLEQIDNVSEEIDTLTGQQTPLETSFLTGQIALNAAPNPPSQTSNNAGANPSPTNNTSANTNTNDNNNTSQTPNNTLASYQPANNQPSIIPPPPAINIIISEVKTESQNSASDEYIELYNPNNFTVNLGGLILRKKTSNGASQSTLVSSSKFQGNIPAFGYFLITPPSTSTGDLHYSGAGYYVSQTNSIFLYDKYDRLLDKAENVVHPRTHSFGRQSPDVASDFEVQLPTPRAANQKDTLAPQIIILAQPSATTSATTAEFSFMANEPDCVFEYQLDNNQPQQSSGGQTPTLVKFRNLAIGQHSLQIRAVDPVGNWADPWQVIWEIVAAPIQPPEPEPKILISEIQTEGEKKTNDFIELYNPTGSDIYLKDYRLVKRSKTSSKDTTIKSWSMDNEAKILSQHYYLWVSSGDESYSLIAQANATTSQTIASDNGAALRHGDEDTGTIIDAVGWGDFNNVLFETAPVQNHTKGYSLGRKWTTDTQTYQDTDNNQNDFEIQTPTPGAKNEKDLTPPETEITAKPPGLTNQSQAIFSFSSSEEGSTFQCAVDSQDWQNCSSPVAYTNMPDGLHLFQVKAIDQANNQDQSPAQYGWTIDTTIASPSLILSDSETHSTTSTNKQAAQVSILQDQEATAWFLSENSGKPTAEDAGWLTTEPLSFNLSANDGLKTVFVWTKDQANNISQLGNSASIVLNTAAPEIIIEPPEPEPEPSPAILEVSTTTLFFSAIQGAGNPASQNLIIQNNGQAQMPWEISVVANWDWVLLATTSGTLLANATTSVEISVDLANLDPGNYQATTTITADDAENSPRNVQINLKFEEPVNQLPNATFAYSPSENLLVGNEITFDASSSTDDGEITAFFWDFGDGSTTTTQTATISHVFSAAGQFQILLTAQDNQGATSSPVSTTLTIAVRPESRLLISEVQIRDEASSTNDFIEIFNPTNQNIDISNFHLRKRASTGSESSVCEFSASSTIAAMGYFLWANDEYQIPGLSADITRASTIAINNSLALLDKNNNIIDQVAWGASANPFMETAPFTPNPANNQTITRRQDGSGNYLDTNNNATDFILASSTPTNSLGQTIQPATSTPATSSPATSTPATSSPAYDPTVPVIADLQANPAADREAVDLWWSNNYANYYLINYNNQTIIFNATSANPAIFATTVAGLTGGQSYQFTVQAITASGATSGPSNVATATPLLAFQDNNDGTINDLYSGLMWPKDGAGLPANNGQTIGWFEAKDFCERLVMCNNNQFATASSTSSEETLAACADKGGVKYDDWRLPNFKELALLIKYQKTPSDGVMINGQYFQNIVADKYWTISYRYLTPPTVNQERWFTRWVNFANGYIDVDDARLDGSMPLTYNYVLPVRGSSAVVSASGFDEPTIGCLSGYTYDAASGLTADLCAGLTKTRQISIPNTGSTVPWQAAITEAASSTLGGYTDWRLPNARELIMSIGIGPQSAVYNHWAITPDYQASGSYWWVDVGGFFTAGQSQIHPDWLNNYFKLFRGP